MTGDYTIVQLQRQDELTRAHQKRRAEHRRNNKRDQSELDDVRERRLKAQPKGTGSDHGCQFYVQVDRDR